MNEFMMIFRTEPNEDYQPTPEQIDEVMKHWSNWLGGMAAQGKFSSANQLGEEAVIVQPGGLVTDGPYVAAKEIVGGYVIVKAETMKEAIALTEDCPILAIGGKVEIRNVMGNVLQD